MAKSKIPLMAGTDTPLGYLTPDSAFTMVGIDG